MSVSMLTQCLSQTERQVVSGILLMLGVSPDCAGFEYLCKAICLYRREPTQLFTKELYPDIARKLGRQADARQIERSMRLAIHTAWAQRDEQIWRMFFPPGAEGTVSKPSNGYFIARLAKLLDIWGAVNE